MLPSNCRWSTGQHDRCVCVCVSGCVCLSLRPFDPFTDLSFILDVAAPSDPAAAVFTQFQPGCGYSAGQWRVHRLWRHPKWSECDPHSYGHPDMTVDADICFVLPPCRSSSEWNDGWSTPDGGVQTGTVVKRRRICKDTLMQDWCCCSQKGGGVKIIRLRFNVIQIDIWCLCMSPAWEAFLINL